MFFKSFSARQKYFLVLAFFVLLVGGIGLWLKTNKFEDSDQYHFKKSGIGAAPVEISGWVAWWAEKSAYDLVQKYPEKIKEVSPVWFMVDRNLNLTDVGEINRSKVIADLKVGNVRVLPSIGSELTAEDMSPLFNDSKIRDRLIEDLVVRIEKLGVDGVDVDLEGIKAEDRDQFTIFLTKLSQRLKKSNLKMSVAVHAQTENIVWEGVLGQDLAKIGEIADEVRIMAYDEHSAAGEAGPVASYDWIVEVANYNLGLIPAGKIVFGIPSYGYVWPKTADPKGLQFDEFNVYLSGKKYTKERNRGSGEVEFKSNDFSAWLSDSDAMVAKIEILQSVGINKFIIWHLGGMDAQFFEKSR